MGKPERFTLLFVHGDGTQIRRLSIPRWVVSGGLLVMTLGVLTLGVLSADYLLMMRQRQEAPALRQRVAKQEVVIETFQRQMDQIQGEVATWGELHAQIWEPFGPEPPHGAPSKVGIGGGTEMESPESSGAPGTPAEEGDLLVASVNEAGQSLRALERFMAKAGKVLGALPSRWPVRGAVTSEFGRRRAPWSGAPEFHSGLDIRARRRMPVNAPAPGKVRFAGRQKDYGLTVVLDHGRGIRTRYGHLSKIIVRRGEQVERGQVIAKTGNSGKSTGPHLHYAITVRGRPVNPRAYLWD